MIVIDQASEPIDIIWKNMGGTRGMFLFRRLSLNRLAIFVLVFITTPTAMVSALSYVDVFNVVSFEWVD